VNLVGAFGKIKIYKNVIKIPSSFQNIQETKKKNKEKRKFLGEIGF